jgi:hypothetical protein
MNDFAAYVKNYNAIAIIDLLYYFLKISQYMKIMYFNKITKLFIVYVNIFVSKRVSY